MLTGGGTVEGQETNLDVSSWLVPLVETGFSKRGTPKTKMSCLPLKEASQWVSGFSTHFVSMTKPWYTVTMGLDFVERRVASAAMLTSMEEKSLEASKQGTGMTPSKSYKENGKFGNIWKWTSIAVLFSPCQLSYAEKLTTQTKLLLHCILLKKVWPWIIHMDFQCHLKKNC